MNIGGGGEQVVLEDGVSLLSESAESGWNGAIAQFDIARLAHDIVGVGDDKVGEATTIFLKSFGALCVRLMRHLCSKISELLVELFDLGLRLEMLEGAADGHVGEADGDGAEGGGVELRVSLHDIERTLWGEGVVMMMDAGYDLAFLGVRVGGDGKVWAFDGRLVGLGGWCAWERDGRWVDFGFDLGVSRVGGWVHKRDGGGTELSLSGDDLDAVAEDGGRHAVVVWKCWRRYDLRERMETLHFFRPLLSCSKGVNGFFR